MVPVYHSSVVPPFKTFFNCEEDDRLRLITCLDRLLLRNYTVFLQSNVFCLQCLLEVRIFWCIWAESIHPSVNDALSEDLQYSDPSLEVL